MRSSILMIVSIVGLIAMGCGKAEGGGTTTPSKVTNRVIKPEDKEPKKTAGAFEDYKPVEIYLDDLTFEEAFEIENLAKGEGHTFWWNGKEYTTDLYIETVTWHSGGQWVRNADDLDDNCHSNNLDECGVCDGLGKLMWYKDLDKDGLGNPNIFTESCIYPSVDEE